MTHLIIGMGQIGTAVYNVLGIEGKYDVLSLDKNKEPVNKKVSVMHICIPYTRNFVKEVEKYQQKFMPELTIVYSTTPIGTVKKIKKTVHCPVEGKHPRLNYGLKNFTRWIGYNDKSDGEFALKVWEPLIRDYVLVDNTDHTEFLKLASTAKYGINIVWAQYMSDVSKKLGMDYSLVKHWDKSYNKLYKRMQLRQFHKYILDAPEGKIGGHCIVPNSKLLDKQHPHDMLKMIGDME